MKISVISTGAAGRRCFLLSMVKRIQVNWGLNPVDPECGFSYRALYSLSDRQLSIADRLPDPRGNHEVVRMRFLKTPIEWVDIMSEQLEGSSERAVEYMDNSECIMICMDGEHLKNNSGSVQEIADAWYDAQNGDDINHFLYQYLLRNKGKLPFICFVVTKMDTIDPELLKGFTMDRIVSRVFPDWFEGRRTNDGHIAAVCPISALGYEFMNGGEFKPVNAEKPLFAALRVVRGRKLFGEISKWDKESFQYCIEGIRFYRNGKWIDESEID